MIITDEMLAAAHAAVPYPHTPYSTFAVYNAHLRATLTAALSGSPQVEAGMVDLGDDWELECRAFNAANDSTLPKDVSILISDLWKAYCGKRTIPREQKGGEAPVAWRWRELMQDYMGGWETKHDRSPPGDWVKPEHIEGLTPLFDHPAPIPADGWKEGAEAMREAVLRVCTYCLSHDGDDTGWIQCAEFIRAEVTEIPAAPTPTASTEAK